MNEFVVDASAAVSALTDKSLVGIALHKRIVEATCHAPHLLDAEVGHVLRRRERLGQISENTALTGLKALPMIIEHWYPHSGRLTDMAWNLRNTITFYDGLYVSLATLLEVPLLTGDVKLSQAPGLTCEIELIS